MSIPTPTDSRATLWNHWRTLLWGYNFHLRSLNVNLTWLVGGNISRVLTSHCIIVIFLGVRGDTTALRLRCNSRVLTFSELDVLWETSLLALVTWPVIGVLIKHWNRKSMWLTKSANLSQTCLIITIFHADFVAYAMSQSFEKIHWKQFQLKTPNKTPNFDESVWSVNENLSWTFADSLSEASYFHVI